MATLFKTMVQDTEIGSLTSLSPSALELVRYAAQHPAWLGEMLELANQNSTEAWLILEKKAGQPLTERDRELLLRMAEIFVSPDVVTVTNGEGDQQFWFSANPFRVP
jgi:hypothetical protein